MRWSVRARTTAATVAVLLPVLAVAGLAGISFQRADLTAGIGSLAEDQARAMVRDLPDGSVAVTSGSDEDVTQVVSLPDGRIEASSDQLGGVEALMPAPATSAAVHRVLTGIVAGEADRYAAVALRTGDGSAYIVVARSLETVDAATASTARLLLAGSLLVLLTVASLTWVVAGRALSPVESMRRRASSISADDLDSRLPVPMSGDEIARLATTLNELLDRIEVSTRTRRQFVADASHELRSPVATIQALIESDRVAPHPGGQDGLAAEVLAETSRLAALVSALLELARGEERAPSPHGPIDLSELVRLEGARVRRVPVALAISEGLEVDGDRDGLAGAVRNLLDNAERHASRAITLAAYRDSDWVHVSVTDDGAGVPPVDRKRIFDRFVRLDDARSRDEGGTGLGLAIVRDIVEHHHGAVAVVGDSPGARFVIRLPGHAGGSMERPVAKPPVHSRDASLGQRADHLFARLVLAIWRVIPGPLRRRIPSTFVGFSLINGFTFSVDLSLLALLYRGFGLPHPVAITIGYAVAFGLAFVLNRRFNFHAHGPVSGQVARWVVVVLVNYTVLVIGLGSGLHATGVPFVFARLVAAAAEAVWMYATMRWWVFTSRPAQVVDRPVS